MVSCECYFACWSAPEVILFSWSFHLLLNPGYRICLASHTKHSVSAHTGTGDFIFYQCTLHCKRNIYQHLQALLSPLLSVTTDQNQNHFHPDCHQHHRQRTDHYHYFCPHSIFPTIQNNLIPILVNAQFFLWWTLSNTGSGQAWLIKTFPRSQWTIAGEVDKIEQL